MSSWLCHRHNYLIEGTSADCPECARERSTPKPCPACAAKDARIEAILRERDRELNTLFFEIDQLRETVKSHHAEGVKQQERADAAEAALLRAAQSAWVYASVQEWRAKHGA